MKFVDYGPAIRREQERKRKRAERRQRACALMFVSLLFWAVFFFTLAGLHVWRVDGWTAAIQPLGVAFACAMMILGGYVSSPVVRRLFSSEV